MMRILGGVMLYGAATIVVVAEDGWGRDCLSRGFLRRHGQEGESCSGGEGNSVNRMS